MRILNLATMAALVLAGAPMSPPSLAATQDRRSESFDPETICRPFLDGYGAGERVYARPRPQSRGAVSGPPMIVSPAYQSPPAPPPPPPPPPPPASPPVATSMPEARAINVTGSRIAHPNIRPRENRERYEGKEVAAIQSVADAPVSTFAVDVDTGSYANVRRMLNMGDLPPQAAVRTEEMLNYFRYDYPRPTDRNAPFTVTTDMSITPWNVETRLLRVGLRGYDLNRSERPAANLVFLVDVSGSMEQPDKLPLVQCSLALLAQRLNRRDRVSIVVYAGAAGVVLNPTYDKKQVMDALSRLRAGGSTAGAEGIQLAYDVARRSFLEDGINRVILATDGDFNVGVTNNEALVDLVERERKAGITLTTLGYGTGNYNEAMMEQIADHGNGNYSYIDSAREAMKVLDQELSSTLFTIAQDVKVQLEFNPAYVSEYRLIGYENRALAEQDFNNDAVDAGDIGAGHQVTALYEIVPVGRNGWLPDRRYPANQREARRPNDWQGELGWLKLRYKLPGQQQSRLIERPVAARMIRTAGAPTGDTAFAAAVAAYGQKLRGDTHLAAFSYADVRRLARASAGRDPWRQEFLRLNNLAESKDMAGLRSGSSASSRYK